MPSRREALVLGAVVALAAIAGFAVSRARGGRVPAGAPAPRVTGWWTPLSIRPAPSASPWWTAMQHPGAAWAPIGGEALDMWLAGIVSAGEGV